jgi:hypothetical protein
MSGRFCEEGRVMLEGVKQGVWEGGVQENDWNSSGPLVLILFGRSLPAARAAGTLLAEREVRPVRLDAVYSHARPRREQRIHVGFSLLHLTLELAQFEQLSLSLGGWVLDWRARRAEDWMSAMII